MPDHAPLSQRIAAPTVLPRVEHADLAVVRAARESDLDALVTLFHASERIDHPSWASPREEVEDVLVHPLIDVDTDTLIAFDATGRAVAYASVMPAVGVETRVQIYLIGTVHPDFRRRGIGTMLVAWSRDRALQKLAERDEPLPAWIRMHAQERTADALAIAERAGFTAERYFHSMQRDLAEPIADVEPAPAVAAEVELVTFGPELAEATRLARNDAFRDHWGSQPTTAERWQRFVTGDIFRADLSVVAVEKATGRVVALTLQSINEDDTELQGYRSSYIDLIGVVRDRRGQKLAPWLISEALRRAKAEGAERVDLDVDTASPTGANTLYSAMGFTTTDVEVAFVLEP